MHGETRRNGLHHPPMLFELEVGCESLTGPEKAGPKVAFFFSAEKKKKSTLEITAQRGSSRWSAPPADSIWPWRCGAEH